jgi:hypothetical protein
VKGHQSWNKSSLFNSINNRESLQKFEQRSEVHQPVFNRMKWKKEKGGHDDG